VELWSESYQAVEGISFRGSGYQRSLPLLRNAEYNFRITTPSILKEAELGMSEATGTQLSRHSQEL